MTSAEQESQPLAAIIRRQAAACDPTPAMTFEHVAADVERVAGFGNLGRSASGHAVPVDEPEQFGGSGQSADPAELLLVAIGASLSVTLTAHAALAGIVLDDIRLRLNGTLDAARFFYPSDAAGGGLADFAIDIAVVTPAPHAAVSALLDRALLASPVLRSIAATPAVTLAVRAA